ncbi:MAG TPA: hypothetical protein VIE65_22445 [Methylobacter sp.]|jgi:hypothetical protein
MQSDKQNISHRERKIPQQWNKHRLREFRNLGQFAIVQGHLLQQGENAYGLWASSVSPWMIITKCDPDFASRLIMWKTIKTALHRLYNARAAGLFAKK